VVYLPGVERLESRLQPGSATADLLFSRPSVLPTSGLAGAATGKSGRWEQEELTLDGDLLVPASVARGITHGAISRAATPAREAAATDVPMVAVTRSRVPLPGTTATATAAPSFGAWAVPGLAAHGLDEPRRGSQAQSEGGRRPAAIAPQPPGDGGQSHVPGAARKTAAQDHYGKLPLSFEPNLGQFDARVDYVAHAGASTVFLTPTAAVFAMRAVGRASGLPPGTAGRKSALQEQSGAAVFMQVLGGNPQAHPTAADPLPGVTNYLIGNDASRWHTGVSTFARVQYADVYPGINLTYYGSDGHLEYDFIVSPGADPQVITLNLAGGDGVEVNLAGDLVVHTAAGDLVQHKPTLYQNVGGVRREVDGKFLIRNPQSAIRDSTTVSFAVGAYDASRPLVIDPTVLGYSTFLGGSAGDSANGMAVDSSGNAYVIGSTSSTNFPTRPGAYDKTLNGTTDIFVSKLNAAGTALVYSTYLGGNDYDAGYAIAVDNIGVVYLTGVTYSSDFPTTTLALDTTYNGSGDAFVTSMNQSGSVLFYSTYLGGSGSDYATGLALDGSNIVYLTGETQSSNYPATAGAFDTSYNGGAAGDAFVSKLQPVATAPLAYSTFLGGAADDHGTGVAVDGSNNAYVTGYTSSSNFPTTAGAFDNVENGTDDAFVTKLNAAGSALVYSTYLGGFNSDLGLGLVIDGSGNAYVTGSTTSSDFPVTVGALDTSKSGIYDGFVTKLNTVGTAAVYSTFLGGSDDDLGRIIKVDAGGNAFVAGETFSSDFPTTGGAFDRGYNGSFDAFVSRLNAAGSSLGFSTYLGGSGQDYPYGLAVDAAGSAYVSGYTDSANFPTTLGAPDGTVAAGEAFVTKLRAIPQPCGCFESRTISTAAVGASSVFAADMDGDGDIDVLSASNLDDKIAWYENQGGGNFTAHIISTSADGAGSVYAADMDRDGDMDVLSASGNDDKIAWYENDGTENFTAHVVSLTANDPTAVVAADVDRDGDMDVVSASFLDNKIAWYENNGSQVFTPHTITTAASGAVDVKVGDVDRDGDLDVLSASAYDDKIAWYENNGAQVFTAHTISTAADYANGVAAVDLDRDGDMDVLSSSFLDNKIAWYENNGTQGFTPHTITTAALGAVDVTAADVNADGFIDVLSASNTDNKIAWYKNDGSQNFTAQTITTQASQALSVFAADVNGDGATDILSASHLDNKIAWYRNLSFQVTTAGDSGPGSLRQAIIDANLNPGLDMITFAVGSGSQAIAPLTALPVITDPVVIDGTTQPGFAGTPLIDIVGTSVPSANGLQVTAGGSTINALGVHGFSSGTGIRLETSGGDLVQGSSVGQNGTGILSVSSNIIQGNFIGTDVSGTLNQGNLGLGVSLTGSNNVIGGTTAGAGNRIAYNGGDGVRVDGGAGNAIRENQIYSNAGLGIALTNGGNGNQNKPSVNSATSSGGTTTIGVTLVSTPSTTFTLDFFSSTACDPSNFGEGETYLGSKNLTTMGTGRGRTVFVAGVQVPAGQVITATATSPGNNTSQFSKCQTVT
jgi:hypothetical protein